jgi:hypothetical protein
LFPYDGFVLERHYEETNADKDKGYCQTPNDPDSLHTGRNRRSNLCATQNSYCPADRPAGAPMRKRTCCDMDNSPRQRHEGQNKVRRCGRYMDRKIQKANQGGYMDNAAACAYQGSEGTQDHSKRDKPSIWYHKSISILLSFCCYIQITVIIQRSVNSAKSLGPERRKIRPEIILNRHFFFLQAR